ncbi:hypothetical protein ACYSNW_04150 [Enterococcus sp. LJL99]
MTNDYDSIAEHFLSGLTINDKTTLYNQLLALEEVHRINQNSSYYTFRNLKRAVHRNSERRKRTITYKTKTNEELKIHQLHEQHFFKNCYKIEVYLNQQKYNFELINSLLHHLKEPVYSTTMVYQEITV